MRSAAGRADHRRLAAACLTYAAVLVASMAAGAGMAVRQGHSLVLSAGAAAVPPTPMTFFFEVLGANGRIWLYTCVGLVSFGLAGFFVLLGNAFRFGMDAASLLRGAPHELVYLLPYASLEFAAFTLSAASCQYLAWCLFELLVLNRPGASPRAGVQALALSLVLLVAAASAETCAHAVRFG